LALDEPELSPRELAMRLTDFKEHFVPKASVYRMLKADDLVSGRAFVALKPPDHFKDKTTAPTSAGKPTSSIFKLIA
jgi:putative transposase